MSIFNNIVLAEWVLNGAVQSLLILGIGIFLLYVLKKRAAPLRSGISLIIMLALLLLPCFSITLNQLNYAPLRTVLPFTLEKPSNTATSVSYHTAEMPVDKSPNANHGDIQQAGTGPTVVRIINIGGMIWLAGTLFMLFRILAGAVSIRLLKRGLKEVSDLRFSAIMNSALRAFPKNIKTQLFLSPKAPYPMSVGIWHPYILIPEHLSLKLKNKQIRSILLHELAHIHHRDQVTGILQRFITALLWWNPLVYILSTSHSRAREEISDNYVLLQNSSKEYAECLINLAEKAALFKWLPVSAGLASPHIPLKNRVKHILSKERNMDINLKKSTFLVMALAALLFLLGIAGSRLTFATPEPETKIEKIDFVSPDLQEQDKKEQQEEEKKSAQKDIKPPKLIRKVNAVYPEEAKKAEIEGVVVLEATTDEYGQVQKVKVLNSVPELDQAAVDAIKQWVYEPMVIDGKPYGVTFTTTCRFSLDDKGFGKSYEFGVTGTDKKPPVPAFGNIKPPKLIRKVQPVYPEIARESMVEGTVILEATTDEYGQVQNIKVLRSIPLLDQAAKDAVRQWVYEPIVIDGESRGAIFTVTVSFKLD